MGIEDIARPEVRDLKAYVAAEQVSGMIRLNANEAAESPWSNLDRSPLNRYPLVRPATLQKRLAELYDVPASNVLVTRGSTEAIDTLIRTFCRAYHDNIVVTPPTFDMYKVYADVQAVDLIRVPLDAANNFAMNTREILGAATPDSKLIFICSPNNPTGTLTSVNDILEIADARRDRSVVVVDEAYIEFSDRDSLAAQVGNFSNLVVLRTLSKAFALAGARCGAVIGTEAAVILLSRVLSPYSFSTPVTERVLDALTDDGFAMARALVEKTVSERQRLAEALENSAAVEAVWPSAANFLFVRFTDIDRVRDSLLHKRILIREFPSLTEFSGCARITIGTADENDQLITALAASVER